MHHRLSWWKAAVVAAMIGLAGLPGDALAMDQAKHDDIKALLQTIGSLNTAKTVIDTLLPQQIAMIKKINPAIPQAVLDEVQKDLMDEINRSLPELEEPLIAIYDANFSADEVKQLLAFYRSPVGQKYVGKIPVLIQQGMAVGKVWSQTLSQRIGEKIREDAKKKGFNL
jgi:uncharacterized protein